MLSLRTLLEKFILLVMTLFGMAIIVFFVAQVVPADPARVAAGKGARPEQVEAMRKSLGLDKPLSVQFWAYMSGLVKGDLGRSLITRRPVLEELKLFFPATLELTLFSEFLIIVVGIPLGVIAALQAGRLPDHIIRLSVVAAMGIPPFALGLILQLVFGRWLGWFPLEGRIDPSITPLSYVTGLYTVDSLLARDWPAFRSTLEHLVLPVMALALGRLAVASRFTRTNLLEVISMPYIRVARAKGLQERTIIYRHALRNSLIPIVTVLGIQIGFLLGGAVLVETVFTWPGLGRYAATSALYFDFYPVIGATLVISMVFVVSSTVVDILYHLIDPRISG